MTKFCVKGTRQACLADRLANAKNKIHTDLRAMETKIYRIANMTMDDYFRDKLDQTTFLNLQCLIRYTGFNITLETSYMEVASLIKRYIVAYPEDVFCTELISMFLQPVWRFSHLLIPGKPAVNNAILRKSPNNTVLRNFYVCMDDYISVIQCLSPEFLYQQSFYIDSSSNILCEEHLPMLLEFISKTTADSTELENKWQLLFKLMIEPYAELYNKQKPEKDDDVWEELDNDNIWDSL